MLEPLQTTSPVAGATYRKLITRLKHLYLETGQTGSQALNQTKLNSYWQAGKELARLKLINDKTIAALAKEVQVEPSSLYRSLHFYRTWPTGLTPEAKKLSWRLHQVLNGIADVKARDFYVNTALAKNWNREALCHALKLDYFQDYQDAPDQGFKRVGAPFHCYKAVVQSVVDGDTLEVDIDVGFSMWTKRRIRLKGINAAELSRPDVPAAEEEKALQAQNYVAKRLSGLPYLVVRTHKTDIYGRYVADVFYHPRLTDLEDIVKKGFFLNEELVAKGLAVRVMG